jgi:hypothetical protein
VTREIEPLDLGVVRSLPTADFVIHEFGAATVLHAFPLRGPFHDLLPISDVLYDNEQLRAASRQWMEGLLEVLGSAVRHPRLAEAVEDYMIFEVKALDPPIPLAQLCRVEALSIAQILRSETGSLSEQEVLDALASQIAFTPDDLAIIDWNAAVLFDRDAEDARTVLELVNAELLEMRHLDGRLDEALERAYETLHLRRPIWRFSYSLRTDLRRIAEMQVDNAILFERANNAMKLLGDQYLARLYHLAAQRFHMREWDESILRKLQTLDSIYQKLTDRTAGRRMEVLEWIIIILIAVSIFLTVLPSAHG